MSVGASLIESNMRWAYQFRNILYEPEHLYAMGEMINNEGYRVIDQTVVQNFLAGARQILSPSDIIVLTSDILAINLERGYALLTLDNNVVRVIYTSNNNFDMIVGHPLTMMKIPSFSPPEDIFHLDSRLVPSVRPLFDLIGRMSERSNAPTLRMIIGRTISELRRGIYNISPSSSTSTQQVIPTFNPSTTPAEQMNKHSQESGNVYEDVLRALVGRIYGIEVPLPEFLVLNGLRINFIPVDQLKVQVAKIDTDPMLQVFAGPPGTPYQIYTIFDSTGKAYLTRAKYDKSTNSLIP